MWASPSPSLTQLSNEHHKPSITREHRTQRNWREACTVYFALSGFHLLQNQRGMAQLLPGLPITSGPLGTWPQELILIHFCCSGAEPESPQHHRWDSTIPTQISIRALMPLKTRFISLFTFRKTLIWLSQMNCRHVCADTTQLVLIPSHAGSTVVACKHTGMRNIKLEPRRQAVAARLQEAAPRFCCTEKRWSAPRSQYKTTWALRKEFWG